MQRLNKWAKGALCIFFSTALVLAGCSSDSNSGNEVTQEEGLLEFKPLATNSTKVIAEYEGGKVTEGELNRYTNIVAFLDPQLGMILATVNENKNEVMEELAKEYAARKYIVSKYGGNKEEAEKQADQTMKEYDDSLNQAASSNGDDKNDSPKNLDEAIKGKGFSKDELRSFLVDHFIVDDYYNSQLKGKTYTHVKVHHVLVSVNEGDQADEGQPKRSDADAKKRAEEVKKKLEETGDFKKLAKEYSDDPGSKENEGIVEGPADMFVPEFANAAKTLPLNQISDPVKTDYGYHVLKVVERKEESLESAPDNVKGTKKQEIFERLVKEELKFKSLL